MSQVVDLSTFVASAKVLATDSKGRVQQNSYIPQIIRDGPVAKLLLIEGEFDRSLIHAINGTTTLHGFLDAVKAIQIEAVKRGVLIIV